MRISFVLVLGLLLTIGCCSIEGPTQVVIDDLATLKEDRNRAEKYVADLKKEDESIKMEAKEKYTSAAKKVDDWLSGLITAVDTNGQLTKKAPKSAHDEVENFMKFGEDKVGSKGKDADEVIKYIKDITDWLMGVNDKYCNNRKQELKTLFSEHKWKSFDSIK